MKLGYHVSIQGGVDKAVDRAVELGCDTFQIFTRNPRSWKTRDLDDAEVEAFRRKRRDARLDPVFDHMPYILNLASPEEGVYRRSVESLAEGVRRCSVLGIPMLVTHIGSHLGAGGGVPRVVAALREALGDGSKVTILLENGSGSKNGVGSRLEEVGEILDGVDKCEQLGVCLDTCHAFAAGYDLGMRDGLWETLDALDSSVGFARLGLVHLNDSVGGLGSGVDRHEHIGLGQIGLEGFRVILGSPLADVPMVMETPLDERRGDGENLVLVREILASLGHDEDSGL
ncbi:MAG: deoxyribonuclease IV [Candidatus Bathyarchaeota archaeon]|nr:MAG: deoxyribonuclease IV [Candidatus Bathyarchaeota archaeon]